MFSLNIKIMLKKIIVIIVIIRRLRLGVFPINMKIVNDLKHVFYLNKPNDETMRWILMSRTEIERNF